MKSLKHRVQTAYEEIAVSLSGTAVTFTPLSGKDVEGARLFSGVLQGTPSLSVFLNRAFEIAISIGAILAVLRILYGGALYMGTDAFGKKARAKSILQDAVLGLLLLLATYLILKQINPALLNFEFNLPATSAQ